MFTYARLCRDCGAQYFPPVPRALAVVCIVVGLLIGIPGCVAFVGALAFVSPGASLVVSLAVYGCFIALGLVAVAMGSLALTRSSSSVEKQQGTHRGSGFEVVHGADDVPRADGSGGAE